MNRTISVQLAAHTLLDLIEQAGKSGESQDPSVIVLAAVEFWLAHQQKRQPEEPTTGVRGYQWKSLFLPEGTMVRLTSYGEYHYACVEGDSIMHEGRALSPNQFTALHANSVRNAWNDLYIRRPGDKFYKVARQLRRELAADSCLPVSAKTPSPRSAPHEILDDPHRGTGAAVQKPRSTEPGPGWTLPERRKYRFRLEDVAFD
jgi:hypothetical protein